MKTTHYSISYLQGKISISKEPSFFSGKPYVYCMHYRNRLVRLRDDSSILYDIVSDSSLAEIYPITYKEAWNTLYSRLVDEFYKTLPSNL